MADSRSAPSQWETVLLCNDVFHWLGANLESVLLISMNWFGFMACSDPLQWRHNGHDGVSNHQPHDCLLSRFLGADQRKHQSSASLAFVREIHRGPVNSPHKWPVTRKIFPFDDVIMPRCFFLLSAGLLGRNCSEFSIKIQTFYWGNKFQNVVCRMSPILFRSQWVTKNFKVCLLIVIYRRISKRNNIKRSFLTNMDLLNNPDPRPQWVNSSPPRQNVCKSQALTVSQIGWFRYFFH